MPQIYTPEAWNRKCDLVYQHVFDSYADEAMGVMGWCVTGGEFIVSLFILELVYHNYS